MKLIGQVVARRPPRLAASPELFPVGSRVGINSLWLLVARAGSQLLALLFTALIARELGEAVLGQYAFMAATLMVGNALSSFGMDTWLIRAVARSGDGSNDQVASALLLQLLLSLVFIGGIAILAPLLRNQSPSTHGALLIFSFSLIPLAFSTSFGAVHRARQRMNLIMTTNLATAALQLAGGLTVVRTNGGIHGLALVTLISTTIGAGLSWSMLRKAEPSFRLWGGLKARSRALSVLRASRAGSSLALLMVVAVLTQRLGILLLSQAAADAEVGLYSAASRVVEAARMIPYAFYGAYFPALAGVVGAGRINGRDPEGTAATVRTAFRGLGERRFHGVAYKLLIAFAFVTAAALTIAGTPLVAGIYGPGFNEAVPAVRLLAWGLIPFIVTLRYSVELVSAGQEKAALAAALAALVTTGSLMLILIPDSGVQGAAVAAVIGETIQAILLFLYARSWTR